jgi:hypothetical protein
MNTTFHNNPNLKAELLAEGQRHLDADMLRQGKGYENSDNGHFVGCTIGCYGPEGKSVVAKRQWLLDRFGLPLRLTAIVDPLFEQLPSKASAAWHIGWVEATPVGVEHSKIEALCDKMILRAAELKIVIIGGDCVHLRNTCDLYRRRIAGDEPSEGEWGSATLDALDALDARAARATLDALDAFSAKLTGYYKTLMAELGADNAG